MKDDVLVLTLARTGTHSDLFGKQRSRRMGKDDNERRGIQSEARCSAAEPRNVRRSRSYRHCPVGKIFGCKRNVVKRYREQPLSGIIAVIIFGNFNGVFERIMV